MVNRDEIEAMLDELKEKTPEEIRKYQKIIGNRDSILNDAREKADQILKAAKEQTTELISEHQIMQQAYAQANEIVIIASNEAQETLDKATADANEIRQSAIEYTDELLRSIESLLLHSIDTTKKNNENLLGSLQGYLDVVSSNRVELSPSQESGDIQGAPPQKAKVDENSEIEPMV